MLELRDPDVFRAVLENLQTGVYLVDREQRILFWNAGAEHITGYLRQEVVGHLSRENILAPEQENEESEASASEARDALASVIRDGKPADLDVALRHKSGHRVPVRLRAVPIRNERGSVIGAAEHFDESPAVASWDRRQTKLAGFGCLDEATGALNHDLTQTHLREALAAFGEHEVPFGVLCIQVDGLDRLRAAYGMAILTEVMRVAAHTLENSLRPSDTMGRWSEDRFLAVLTECSANDIRRVAERLRKMVSSSAVHWWGDNIPITASLGAAASQPGDSVESIVARAAKALDASLAARGNCVTQASP